MAPPPAAVPQPMPAPSRYSTVSPWGVDSPDIAKARDAVRARMAELDILDRAEVQAHRGQTTPGQAQAEAAGQPGLRAQEAEARRLSQNAPGEAQARRDASNAGQPQLATSNPSGMPAQEAQPQPGAGAAANARKDSSQEANAPKVASSQSGQAAEIEPQPGKKSMSTAPEPKAPKVKRARPSPFPDIGGPDSPLSIEKQRSLKVLLDRYKADEITPEEYHAQRAKILSEP